MFRNLLKAFEGNDQVGTGSPPLFCHSFPQYSHLPDAQKVPSLELRTSVISALAATGKCQSILSTGDKTMGF